MKQTPTSSGTSCPVTGNGMAANAEAAISIRRVRELHATGLHSAVEDNENPERRRRGAFVKNER